MKMHELIERAEEQALDRMGVPKDPDNRAARRYIDALQRANGDHRKAISATVRRVKATKDRQKLLGIALYMDMLANQHSNWRTWAKSARDPRVMSDDAVVSAQMLSKAAKAKADGKGAPEDIFPSMRRAIFGE